LTFWLNSRVYRITERTVKVTEQGHITERYTKAIEQLGSDKLDVRLGGIYALEHIAVDSPSYHPTIVEVLSAFTRDHSQPIFRWRQHMKQFEKLEELPPQVELQKANDHVSAPEYALPDDIQAAARVLGRLGDPPSGSRGDLHQAHLARAQLDRANLSGARLTLANLSGATLGGADLSDARLRGADLSDAQLLGANLSGAMLNSADLSGATLGSANLSGARLAAATLSGAKLGLADLSDARLWGADLSDAALGGANLSGADLSGVNLLGARLDGANLRQARKLTQAQLNAALGDAETGLPAGLERPASWVATAPPTPPASVG
jgi:uncharacterized protein YjbI with pentapeptide repeats